MLADFFPMIHSVRPSVRRNARAMGGVGIRPASPPVWRRPPNNPQPEEAEIGDCPQFSVALQRGGEAPVTIWSRLHLVPERIGTFWVLDAAIDEESLCLLTVEGTSIAFQVVDFVQGSAERRKSVVGWQRDAGARILTRESVAGQISGKLRDRSLRVRIVAFRGGSRPSYTTEFRLAADGESLERVVPGAATSRPDDTN